MPDGGFRPRSRRSVLAAIEDYEACRVSWRQDPVGYMTTRLGFKPTSQQQELLEAIAPNGARVSCRAGHGVGKTRALAVIHWWFLECFDFAKIPCTAPTASQLYTVLWSEIAAVQRRADEQADKIGLGEQFRLSKLFKVVQDRVYDPSAPTEWFSVARTSRKEAPDALQGYHASDVDIKLEWAEQFQGFVEVAVERSDAGGSILFILDEASGIPDEVIHVVEGALASNRARLVMCGNPTKTNGFFYDSHNHQRTFYTPLHFSCAGSPLPPTGYRADLVRKYGENSNIVRVRADGDFPKQDDDTLISLEIAEAAILRKPAPDDGSDLVLGVDVARHGNDRTTFILRKGSRIIHIEVHAKESLMQTAGRVKALYDRFNPRIVNVDATGMGWGVVDRLKELDVRVNGVQVAETGSLPPLKRTRHGENTPEAKYSTQVALPKSLRDYLWMAAAEWLEDELPSFSEAPNDYAQDLAGELASVKYHFDSSGKIVVESKDDMKKRLKSADGAPRSPDLADGLCLTFAPDDTRSIWERLV
jgi:phage terminase large subunit